MIRTSKCNYLFIDPRIKAYNKELFTSRTSGIDHHLSLPKKTHTQEKKILKQIHFNSTQETGL
jgi:hypothetical protein